MTNHSMHWQHFGPGESQSQPSTAGRIAALDWHSIAASLEAHGFAHLGRILSDADCAQWIAGYDRDALFRSRVVMAQHGFGRGEYRYFAYPLPQPLQQLRTALYARLAPIANRWAAALRLGQNYPATHAHFLAACHAAGQARPTPLLLRYREGDFNCLHQDLYGALHFPLQVTALLSRPGHDFEGGEFVLTEQRPRRQARAQVVPFAIGEALVFAVNERPVPSARGPSRARMRHGVSTVRRGERYTLGIIFHDAA
jgi:uncharacterized protein